MAIDKVLYFPLTVVQTGGVFVQQVAPVVSDLTLSSTGTYQVVSLIATIGATADGMYILNPNTGQWRRVLPYLTLNSFIFDAVTLYVYVPTVGTTVLQTQGLGSVWSVYRNASAITAFTTSSNNIILSNPSQTNDTFCVVAWHGNGGSGGGITDAPANGLAYVRQNASWSTLDSQILDEGNFGS